MPATELNERASVTQLSNIYIILCSAVLIPPDTISFYDTCLTVMKLTHNPPVGSCFSRIEGTVKVNVLVLQLLPGLIAGTSNLVFGIFTLLFIHRFSLSLVTKGQKFGQAFSQYLLSLHRGEQNTISATERFIKMVLVELAWVQELIEV